MENCDFYKNLLDNLSEGVYFVNKDRVITYWNKAAERITGYRSSEVIGRKCSDNMLNHIDDRGTQLCTEGCPLSATMQDAVPRQAQVYLKHQEGYRLPVCVRVIPIRDSSGNIVGGVETFSDDSTGRTLEARIAELEKLSLIDGLTGIGNRRFGDITLNTRFSEFRRYGWQFGLILCDIDNFKMVNDTYGHSTGDEILKMLADTVTGVIREPESSFFRWGGEEFMVIASNIDAARLFSLAERVRILIANSALPQGDRMLQVTISGGATVASNEDKPEQILSRVDRLLYQAKKAGKNCCKLG